AIFLPQLQSSMKNLDAIRSVAYTTSFTNSSFRDVMFVDAPADKRGDLGSESQPNERKSLVLTSESSLFYSAQSVNLSKMWDTIFQQLQQSSESRIQEALFQLDKFNRDNGVNLPKDFLDSVGPEYSFTLNWDKGVQYPELIVAFQ